MSVARRATAYCGLCCLDCIPACRRLFEAVRELREVLDELDFSQYAAVKAKRSEAFAKYGAFAEVLAEIEKLGCTGSCYEGPHSELGCTPNCEVRSCVVGKGLGGCWACDEHHDCSLLAPLKRFHPGLESNLETIRRLGIEGWLGERGRHYTWSHDPTWGRGSMVPTSGPLDPEGRQLLADALGDTPETAIPAHLLKRGLCEAYVAGDASHLRAAIIRDQSCPGEPYAFGADAAAVWDLLASVKGWWCVGVPAELAAPLGEIMSAETGKSVRHYRDVYHVLLQPAPYVESSVVRELGLPDLGLLESAPAEVGGAGFGGPRALLTEGVAACAVVDGGIVAIAQTYARTPQHADIGVGTLELWRNRGFATAAASIVARRVQEAGQTPVWSAGEDNHASLRVAAKLGFTEVSRRVYLIPER